MTEETDLRFHDIGAAAEPVAPDTEQQTQRRRPRRALVPEPAGPTAEATQPVHLPPGSIREDVFAADVVVNSECCLTDGCRGKMTITPASVGNRVQVFCSKCLVVCNGTIPRHGMFRRRTFDRLTAEVREASTPREA